MFADTLHSFKSGCDSYVFGWDQNHEDINFARFFKLHEVRIITTDGQDVGWIQEQISEQSINLGSFYIALASTNASGKGSAGIKSWIRP